MLDVLFKRCFLTLTMVQFLAHTEELIISGTFNSLMAIKWASLMGLNFMDLMVQVW